MYEGQQIYRTSITNKWKEIFIHCTVKKMIECS